MSWRSGTKGRLKARFAAVRVRTADGPPQRIWDKGQQHLPGDEAWLIGEHRASGEKKYYLAGDGKCSSPPAGRARWTLKVLADALVRLTAHESVSRETVRRRLVSRLGPPPRSFAADAHDCIMVRSLWTYRIQGCGAILRARWQAPLGPALLSHLKK